MQLNNKVYDILKWVVLILLPSMGTLYFALSMFWALPYVDEVVGTIVALAAFLGSLIGISSKSYSASDGAFDGVLEVNHTDPEKDTYSFVLTEDLDKLETKNQLVIKVSPRNSVTQ